MQVACHAPRPQDHKKSVTISIAYNLGSAIRRSLYSSLHALANAPLHRVCNGLHAALLRHVTLRRDHGTLAHAFAP
jgi:hypothetical protein